MKHVIKLFASMTLVLFLAVSMNAQTATTVANDSETKKCDVKKCDPAACDLMVKAGLCTKEQAAKCQAVCGSKSTQVASASVERVEAIPVAATTTNAAPALKASCAKTCSNKKKSKTE